MKFKDLIIIETSFILEGINHNYKIYINGLNNLDRKQEFLDCINEFIHLDKFEVENRDSSGALMPDKISNNLNDPIYKAYTYSKYDISQIFKNLKATDFSLNAAKNLSNNATGYVWYIKLNTILTKKIFNYNTIHGMYLKVMFQNDTEPKHSRNGLGPDNGKNFLSVNTLKVKIEFISAHDAKK